MIIDENSVEWKTGEEERSNIKMESKSYEGYNLNDGFRK